MILIALSPGLAAVAAALHAESGLPEIWDAHAFGVLLEMPGVAGRLVTIGDAPAGLILWRVVVDEAEILTLCVAAPHRRRGVGGALLQAAFNAVRQSDVERMFLEVADDNNAAIGLYTGRGFQPLARRFGYYRVEGTPIDALVFRKDFDASRRVKPCADAAAP